MIASSVMKPVEKSAKTDETDGTRAAQDQLAQQNAPKFQLVPEPAAAPAPQPPVGDVATSTAPTVSLLEQAVHGLLDQMQGQMEGRIGAMQSQMQSIVKQPAASAPAAGEDPAAHNALVAMMSAVTPEAIEGTFDLGAIKDLLAAVTDDSTTEDDKSKDKAGASIDVLPFADAMAKPQDLSGVAPAKGPVAVVAVRDPQPLPENLNPSHVHLVLENDGERMVVTVAVRGNEVSATVRGGDEQTAASIARNAASLDHAMRARGLDLTNFTAERELGHDRRKHEAPDRSREDDAEETQVFRMEEKQ